MDYSIFRPCGLNDNWPAGSRPVFSQGDVAVGRINRRDVAKILVDLLSESQAVGKTFEGFSIKGYLSTASVGVALSLLSDDSAGKYLHPDSLTATYAAMQQLLPGESQDDLV